MLALTHVVVASMKHHPNSFNLLRYLGGTAYGTGAVVEWTPMWFLTCVFVSVLVAHRLLAVLRGRAVWLGYAVALALVAVGTQIIGKFWLGPFQLGFAVTRPAAGLPWSVDLLPITVGFMLLGRMLSGHMKTFTFSTWGFCASAALFVGLHFVSDNVMNLNNRIYGEPVTSTLKALAGIYLCLSICALLARVEFAARTLSYLGQATLFILIFHYPIQRAAFARLDQALGQPWLAALASLAISVLASLALWELTARHAGLRRLIR
jgi:fucose 4-O-acetylase-like acetyltransferase